MQDPGSALFCIANKHKDNLGTQQRIISFCWQNIAAALSGKTPRNLIPNR